jgi:chromosome segregation ATPase
MDTQRDLYQGKLARRDARITRLEGRIEQRDEKIHDLERQLKLVRDAISASTSNSSSRKRARANRRDDDQGGTVAAHYKGNKIVITVLQLQC